MKRVLTLAAFAAVMVVCAADTWWVQKEGGVDAEGRGTAEATPFRTIQYAIDAASAGDTILVKPGIYDEGYGTYTDTSVYDESQLLTNRVHISKRLTLKSTDGAAVTHIVGKWSGDPTNHGVGPDAIRCIYATTANTVIEGFTIRDGAAHVHAVKNPDTGIGIDSVANQGGGVRSVNANVYIVDCVISNCIGTRGGAMRYGTAVRCRIVDNFTVSGTAVGRDARFVNCFIARNRTPWNSSGNQVFKCSLYNCTCVENPDTPFCASSCSVYNSVIMSAGWTPVNDNSDSFARNSVYDRVAGDTKVRFASDDGCVTNASPFQFFAPMLGDYRLLPSSDAVGCGDAAHLASLSLPSGVDAFVDIDGNAIPQTGAINAGCAQTVGPEPASGALAFENKECAMKVAGCDYVNMAANSAIVYAFSETVPQLYRVTPVMPEEGYEFYNVAHLGNAAFSQEYPLMDDTIWCAVPAKGHVVTNRINCAKWAYWVDPVSGSDTPLADETRGTSNAPFASIQAAVDASANNSCTVIHCAEGVYDNSEIALDGHADYGTNRVCVTSAKCVRIKGAGVGKSIIKGRLATGSGSSGGAGPDAIRCVAMFGTWSCVQGFTLADGSTDAGTAATVSRYGGAFYASSSASGLYDCLITNCIAYRGTATFQGRIVRCEVKGCPASTGGMVRNTHTYSSFLHDNVKWIDGTTSGTAYGNGSPGRYNTIVGDANCNAFDRYGGPQYNSIVLQKDSTYSSTLSDVPHEYQGNDDLRHHPDIRPGHRPVHLRRSVLRGRGERRLPGIQLLAGGDRHVPG